MGSGTSDRSVRPRRRGPTGLVIGLLAAVLAGFSGGYALSQVAPAPAGPAPGTPARATPPGGTAGSSGHGGPWPTVVATAGTGRFASAPGTGGRAGTTGRLIRYQVMVEVGSGVDPAAFAPVVEATLADRRGWTAGGEWSFQRVDAGRVDLVVHLATPATTDQICGRYGLRTRGEVSCRGGPNVVINLKRWLLGVPWYADALDEYRRMLVNHEVGHFLGHPHATCPAPGALAPVMQTQTYDLAGCVRNPWPYPAAR